MPSAEYASAAPPPQVKMPSGSARAMQSSRSSRRGAGSSAPKVVLGGGAGILGSQGGERSSYGSSGRKSEELGRASPFLGSTTSPRSPHFPVQFHSPSSPSFPPNISQPPQSSSHARAPSPQPRSTSGNTKSGTSNSSLSTTASTSSRTLKTPHAKADQTRPEVQIASSSGSLEGHASPSPAGMHVLRTKEAPISPTPAQPRKSSLGSGGNNKALPTVSQQPLPPLPPLTAAQLQPQRKIARPVDAASPVVATRREQKGQAGGAKKEHRLSQDWVQIAVPESAAEVAGPSPPRPTANRARSATQIGRLPAVGSVPMKGNTPSPVRPAFDRASTAPLAAPISPTPAREGAGPQGRVSLDQLRSASPTPQPRSQPQPMRQRLNSMSTPPALVLDAAKESKGGSMGMFRSAAVKRGETPPPFVSRRSEDVLRSGSGDKDARGAQQQALGNGTAPGASGEERKSSGLSLKKSSGALKALFNRGASGKGKEKEVTPPMPSTEERSVGMAKSRPSTSTADSRPSFARPRTPSSNSPVIESPRERENSAGRASFSVERSLYPAPPMNRTVSDSAATVLSGASSSAPAQAPRLRAPAREPPAIARLPPPETLSTADSDTSLAYMARNSVVLGDTRPLSMYRDEPPQLSTLPSSESMDFERKPVRGQSEGEGFHPLGLPTVKSLHLLALPDMDLNFDVSFDGIGSSPTTPRKSRKAGAAGSPIPSPQRSRTFRESNQSSPTGQRHRADRRRSRSFDGIGGSTAIGDMWRGQGEGGFIPPNVAKLFGNPSSSSAPLLSKQLVDFSSSPDLSLEQASVQANPPKAASPTLAPSSAESSAMSHDRTPSNASSMNESTASPSPSPPRTPPDVRQAFGPKPVYPTRSASSDSHDARSSSEETGEKTWSTLGKAPSMPLPALPELGPAVIPSMTVTPVSVPAPSAAPVKPALSIPATIPEQQLASPADIFSTSTSVTPTPTPAEKSAEITRAPPPLPRARKLHTKSQRVVPDALTSTKQLAREMETLLQTFKYPSHTTTGAERASMVRTELLTLIVELDKRPVESREDHLNVSMTEAAFQWCEALLFELRVDRAANERGACLEGLAAMLESSCLSEKALQKSRANQSRFTQLMIKAMTFVMGKLGAKGVFHNTLLFSGRFLAFAFFRVPHIAEQLVTVLPPPQGALMRFTRTVLVDSPVLPTSAKPKYPEHLSALCFDDSRSYTARLSNLSADFATHAERSAFLFQPGNWLRRWQSDDSELFPAFYRAYHRQLAHYLSPVLEHYEKLDRPVPASILLRAPGYAHLATVFATKCHSYILGSVNAVTTSSSANNFEAQETAGFRGSQKPAVLETANRRIVETLSTFANLRMVMPSSGHMIECDGSQLWGDMIDVWTKSIISKTSLYAPKGVFSLFDLLDGIVDPPFDTLPQTLAAPPLVPTLVPAALPNPFLAESLLDVPHLIYVIRMILTEGEHALTLVKVIAFVFTHWEVLTARAEDRKELCLGLLLTKELFERLTLFWSQSVRSYILRLVVFRLGHLHTKAEDGEAHQVEIESVKLLQTRLDRIKKRHDELEPKPATADLEADSHAPLTPLGEGGLSHSRSTITMIQDSPSMGGSSNKAERLLGLGFGMEAKEEEGRIGKATNWFKKRVGGKKGSKGPGSRSPSPSPSMEGSPFLASSSSPKLGAGSPLLRPATTTPKIPQKSGLGSPMFASSSSDSSADSPRESSAPATLPPSTPAMSSSSTGGRKAPPPTILTTHHSPETHLGSSSPAGVAFEFELPTASPRSDAFDPAPPISSPRRQSQPPSPRGPSSPHMSRSFSKRSSLLPPPTASALDSLFGPNQTQQDRGRSGKGSKAVVDVGYPEKKHAYAIRMLAELEDAQKEYDEWWSENGVGRMDGAPPRLTVAWPFHDGDD